MAYLEELEFDSKSKVKRKSRLISDLDEIDDEVPVLTSSIYLKSKDKKKEKKSEKKEVISKEDIIDTDWMDTITSFKSPKTNKKGKGFDWDSFNPDKKKKKKNKKKDGEKVNHKKDFEPELMLLRNLQVEQSKFVDSLQKKYDQLESTKSTARGVGKYTTDLINSITSARKLSLDLVDKVISAKKTVADLDFKERKEFGAGASSEQQNLTNYASTYLKQVMNAGRSNLIPQSGYQDYQMDNDDDDDFGSLFDSINENLGDSGRSDETDKYLKYENDGVEIRVIYNDDADDDDLDNKFEYVAYNKYGETVDDYPLPEKTRLSINRSTNIATDKYGNKYKMI